MHTTYFTETIQNWQDWAAVFQSISAFEPLIRAILQKEKLPLGKVTQLTPGTNAVFRVEQLVIKIYAPKESGMDQTSDQKQIRPVKSPSVSISVSKHCAHSFIFVYSHNFTFNIYCYWSHSDQ